jgi:hypothetical protein
MAQLELFSRSQMAAVRDRTASRNYSPVGDAFRREHERHREWGLRQRHGRRLMYLRMYGEAAAPGDRTTGQPSTEPPAPAPAPPSNPAGGTRPAVAAFHPDGREPSRGRDTGSSEAHPADETAAAAAAHQDHSAGQAEPIDRLERRDRADSARPGPAGQPEAAGRLSEAGQSSGAGQHSPDDQHSPDGERRRADRATPSIPRPRPPARPRRPVPARSAGHRSVRPGHPARSRRPGPPRRHFAGQATWSAPTDGRAPPAGSGAPLRPAAGPNPDDSGT